MNKKKVVLVIGCQRSGSNFLLSALRSLENLGVFGEMFHRKGMFPFKAGHGVDEGVRWELFDLIIRKDPNKFFSIPKGLHAPSDDVVSSVINSRSKSKQTVPEKAATIRNNLLIRLAHFDPSFLVEIMQEHAGGNTVIFKVFPEHLSTGELRNLIDGVRPIVVFNLRNTLDTYISFKKLVLTKTPQDKDTTSVKIDFNITEYVDYVSEIRAFYFAARDFAQYYGLPFYNLTYDEIHIPEANDLDKARYLAARIEDWTGEHFRLKEDELSTIRKQDKSKSNADKLNNPELLPKEAFSIF